MAEPIRLGVLGPGGIFRRVMSDMHKAKNIRITAVASRSMERAEAAAKLCGAEHVFSSYEELAACPDVDLVYIATPHSHHKDQAILCMEHGKHVICEKAMARNDSEVAEMAACAKKNGVFLMEAMWSRFFPAAVRMLELVKSGEIGEILHVTANFCYRAVNLPATHRINAPELAGGGLLDVGVYTLEAITNILGYEPETVQGLCLKTDTGVDRRFSVQMLYPSGATAQFTCATDLTTDSTQMIYGTKGRIEIPDFWHATSFTVHYANGETAVHTFPAENEGHHHEFEHAAKCIREGLTDSPVISLAETEAVARIMRKLRYENGIYYPQEEK